MVKVLSVSEAPSNEVGVRAAFAQQARWNEKLGSPFMATLCAALAEAIDRSTATGARLLDWPGDPNAGAVQMRLTGGLNALVRRGAAPELAAHYPPNPTPDAATLGAAAAAANSHSIAKSDARTMLSSSSARIKAWRRKKGVRTI